MSTLNAQETPADASHKDDNNELPNDENPCKNGSEANTDDISAPADTASDKQGEEFNYLRRNLFTSEIFKIEVRNLPKYYGFSEFKKLLTQKLELKLRKVKSTGTNYKPGRWLYVCFDSKEEQLKAVNLLHNYNWKNCVLEAKIAEPAPDPLVKRKLEDGDGQPEKRAKILSHEEMEESMKRAAIPWFDVPYPEQVDKKMTSVKNLITKFGFKIISLYPNCKRHIEQMKRENDGLPCKVFPCRGLPEFSDGYRNKCEFTIGLHAVTGEKTVGFRLGTYSSGSVEVAPIGDLRHIGEPMKQAVDTFQKYITNSDIDCYSPATHQGVWGSFTVKTSQNGDLMLIVGVHQMNVSDELASKIKAEIKDFFETGEGSSLTVTSLYLQMLTRRSGGTENPVPELILGKEFISEKICGVNFRISPLSFFQVNIPCAEIMMEGVKQLANVDKNTTILDVCCGTGTLGLCLANDCFDVIGVEKEPQAVADAERNAIDNNISNCQFFCGLADVILPSAVRHAKTKNIVALVDPPRAGLHRRAVRALRKVETIKKIIYLSCDARLAFTNFLDLCKAETKSMEGPPFVLRSVYPVDMFPHTERYELVLYFERVPGD